MFKFLMGIIKFTVGVVAGASTGAAVATLIVTRDPNQTLTRLQGVVAEVVQGGKEARLEEEGRMEARRRELIGEVAQERQLKAAEQKALARQKKDDDKDKKAKNK